MGWFTTKKTEPDPPIRRSQVFKLVKQYTEADDLFDRAGDDADTHKVWKKKDAAYWDTWRGSTEAERAAAEKAIKNPPRF